MAMDALDHLLTSPVLLLHVTAALFALALGPLNLIRRPRDRTHRLVGRTWAAAMGLTAVTSFGVQEPLWALSGLHALSLWTLISLTLGIAAIRRGDVRAHRAHMVGSYLGLWAAFLFAALVPTRTLSQVTAAAPLTPAAVSVVLLAVAATWWLFRPRRRSTPGRSTAPAESRGGLGESTTWSSGRSRKAPRQNRGHDTRVVGESR